MTVNKAAKYTRWGKICRFWVDHFRVVGYLANATRYKDTIRQINVRSKADEMASLI